MVERLARSTLNPIKSKPSRRWRAKGVLKRSLNAYSIANAQAEDQPELRRHRYGESEDDEPTGKRKREPNGNLDSGSEVEGEGPGVKTRVQRAGKKSRVHEADFSQGSDSEGNRWMYGHVDEEDDSDIDSDEAFDDQDAERFAGFTFPGSSSGKANRRHGIAIQTDSSIYEGGSRIVDTGISLNEQDSRGDSEGDESLGEEAIDLATALDQYSGSSEDEEGKFDGHDHEYRQSDASISGAEEGDEEEQAKLARLQDLVTAMHPNEPVARTERILDLHEGRKPSATGIRPEKFDIKELFASSDPSLRNAAKEFSIIPTASKKKDVKLGPQLPKRQQDKLDRKAASNRTKKTLERWDATVKQNRMAEHLSFPLVDKDRIGQTSQKQFVSATRTGPLTTLEGTIHSILQESGLATGDAKVEEKRLEEFEALQTNSMPIEEVTARRAELRKQRELLFREELRAKRIKKIKSKAYRRVHRKERERLTDLDRDAFAETLAEMDEDAREMHDRRRAEERMGSKHRNSKWAKQMKKSGRSIWDEEARSGVVEMAKKSDELRRRIDGRKIQNDKDEGEGFTTDEDDAESASGDSEADARAGERQLQRDIQVSAEDSSWSRLAQLDFMKRAEMKRKEENDESIRQLRRNFAGEEDKSDLSESDELNIGRKVFGPSSKQPEATGPEVERNPFEAPGEGWEDDETEFHGFKEEPTTAVEPEESRQKAKSTSSLTSHGKFVLDPAKGLAVSAAKAATKGDLTSSTTLNGSSGLVGADGSLSKRQIKKAKAQAKASLESNAKLLPREKHSRPDADGWVTVTYNRDEAESEEESEVDQLEIVRRAFAGDDVELEFQKEKDDVIAEENEKFIVNTLPGWGSWIGEGLSKREKLQHEKYKGRNVTKQAGIKPEDRKDKKLRNVIINQRRIKNNAGYLASTLPFPFSQRREYERAIRMPVGNEWNTSGVYRRNTKPRVLVKPGEVIAPMEKPILS